MAAVHQLFQYRFVAEETGAPVPDWQRLPLLFLQMEAGSKEVQGFRGAAHLEVRLKWYTNSVIAVNERMVKAESDNMKVTFGSSLEGFVII